jgi:acetylornithine deacetylase
MDVFQLTRELIDIPSVTPEEFEVGQYLHAYLNRLVADFDGCVEKTEVEPNRFNVFACFGTPVVTMSTHMDTVPPFIPSREDDEFIWGRGACDTKGIIASMLVAAERLLEAGTRNFGLLFVVGEERNSAGAYHAAENPRGSKYIINGEPTENHLALGSKGALRYEVVARGRMAHSAYPELGDSAINKLLDALQAIRGVALPVDDVLGPSTLNIGLIHGGRAPNVIPDEARAELFIRLVCDSAATRRALEEAVGDTAELNFVLEIPALRLTAVEGLPTTVVAYTTDIPAFGGKWGQPLLFGPGTIHVAHTLDERVPKSQLLDAVEIYQKLVRQLQIQ